MAPAERNALVIEVMQLIRYWHFSAAVVPMDVRLAISGPAP